MDAVAATDDSNRKIIVDHETKDAAIREFIETTDRNPRHPGSPRTRSCSHPGGSFFDSIDIAL
jgi:hypothetical protein